MHVAISSGGCVSQGDVISVVDVNVTVHRRTTLFEANVFYPPFVLLAVLDIVISFTMNAA